MSPETGLSREGLPAKHPAEFSGHFLTELMRGVRKNPSAAILAFGLLILLVAVTGKIGSFEFHNSGPRWLAVLVGAVLTVTGFVTPIATTHRRLKEIAPDRKIPPEAHDVDFLMKIFYLAMPPAFVKRIDESGTDGSSTPNILYSKGFVRFQDSPQTQRVSNNERYLTIKSDHRRGDDIALEHDQSLQIEFPDSCVNGKLRPILTYKTKFEHRGHTYIAGWYVPVDTTGIPDDADEVCLSQEIDQVQFRLSRAKRIGDGATVSIGQAVKSALTAPALRPVTRGRASTPASLRPTPGAVPPQGREDSAG